MVAHTFVEKSGESMKERRASLTLPFNSQTENILLETIEKQHKSTPQVTLSPTFQGRGS